MAGKPGFVAETVRVLFVKVCRVWGASRPGSRKPGFLTAAATFALLAGCGLAEHVTPTPLPTSTSVPTLTLVPTATQTPILVSPPVPPSPTPMPGMTVYYNPTAFSLQYPADWTYYIPHLGMLIIGELEGALQNKPGPSFVVFRKEPLGIGEETARDLLENYLERGPLSEGYLQTGKITPVTIGGLEGVEALVEEPEAEDRPLMLRSYVASVVTSQGVGYVFTATSPQQMWDDDWPTLRTIRDSITFPEHLK